MRQVEKSKFVSERGKTVEMSCLFEELPRQPPKLAWADPHEVAAAADAAPRRYGFRLWPGTRQV